MTAQRVTFLHRQRFSNNIKYLLFSKEIEISRIMPKLQRVNIEKVRLQFIDTFFLTSACSANSSKPDMKVKLKSFIYTSNFLFRLRWHSIHFSFNIPPRDNLIMLIMHDKSYAIILYKYCTDICQSQVSLDLTLQKKFMLK